MIIRFTLFWIKSFFIGLMFCSAVLLMMAFVIGFVFPASILTGMFLTGQL